MNAIESIKEYWAIILFVLGLAYHVLWTYFKVDNHQSRIKELEERAKESDINHARFDQMFAEINAKLDLLVEGYQSKKKK